MVLLQLGGSDTFLLPVIIESSDAAHRRSAHSQKTAEHTNTPGPGLGAAADPGPGLLQHGQQSETGDRRRLVPVVRHFFFSPSHAFHRHTVKLSLFLSCSKETAGTVPTFNIPALLVRDRLRRGRDTGDRQRKDRRKK